MLQRTTNDASLEVIRMNFQGAGGGDGGGGGRSSLEKRSDGISRYLSLLAILLLPSLLVLDGVSRETWKEGEGRK